MPSRRMRPISLLALLGVTALLASCAGAEPGGGTQSPATSGEELTKVTLVLPWVVQGESAGFISAKAQGFYEEAGLDVEIIPGGPDVRPAALLATGAVDFAVTGPTTVLTAREEGMPLVAVFTQNQEDGVNFICKKETGISGWEDLAGRTVGVWAGGSDTRAFYGVELAGLNRDDVQWFPQKFSMTEFFEDQIDCAVAMAWNEVHVVLNAGYAAEDLVFLRVSDLGVTMAGDVAVVTEQTANERPEIVQAFTDASLRGWAFALNNPEEATDDVLQMAPELDRDAQFMQVEEANRLVLAGIVGESGRLGDIDPQAWRAEETALIGAGVLPGAIEGLSDAYSLTFVDAVPADISQSVDRDAVLARITKNTGN